METDFRYFEKLLDAKLDAKFNPLHTKIDEFVKTQIKTNEELTKQIITNRRESLEKLEENNKDIKGMQKYIYYAIGGIIVITFVIELAFKFNVIK